MSKLFKSLFFISFVFAQFDWQDNGLPVRQGNHIEWLRTADKGNEGEIIFAWSDTRSGGRDIYVKKIDQNGDEVWGDTNGILVVSAPGRQEDPILISDGSGGAYVMWKDYRDEPDDGDFYAQYVLSDGSLAWDDMGVPLTTVPGPQVSPNMSGDGAGGAFAIWNDQSTDTGNYGHVYGTHLSPNGVLAEGVGIPLNVSPYEHAGVSIEIAAPGSAIMVWSDNRNIDLGLGNDIYAQRIDSQCNTLWSAPEEGGIAIYSGEYTQGHAKVTYYSDTASIIVWDDNRNDPPVSENGPTSEDIYAQFIDMDGNILFSSDGIAVSIEESRQYKPRVKGDSQGAYVIWSDTRYNNQTPALNDIFIQRLTLEDGLVWDEARPLCINQLGDQTQARLSTDSYGGAFVTWMDDRNESNFDDIYLQHIDSDGDFTFDVDGIGIGNADGLQMNPLVRTDSGNGAFIVWGDFRTGSLSIYLQHLNLSNELTLDVNGDIYASGLGGNTITEYSYRPKSAYLGNGESLIYWVDQRYGVFGQNIYGQKVSSSGWSDDYSSIDLLNYIENYGKKLTENNRGDFPSVSNIGSSGDILMGFSDLEATLQGPGASFQILDNDLNLSGNQDGTLLSNPSESIKINSINLSASNNGEVYYAFSEYEYFVANVFMQKFDVSGNPVSAPVRVVEDFMQDNIVNGIAEIENQGLLIAFDSESWMGSTVQFTGVDYDGNPLNEWEGLLDLTSYNSNQKYRGMVSMEDMGFFIIWDDDRNGNSDIYGQRIDLNGNIIGDADGIAIAVADNDQTEPTISYNQSLNEVMVCWEDYRSGTYYDIFCNTIDGESLEVGEEIVVSALSYNQRYPFVYSTTGEDYLVAWQDSRNDPGENLAPDDDIYIQQILNGNNMFQDDGIVVCNEDFSQTYPQIELYNEESNSYMIYWNDNRSSGKEDLVNIYVQSISIQPQECLVMDVNNDGIINVLDIVLVVNIIFGDISPDNQQSCAGDANGDGIINVLDVVLIVNSILTF